MADHPPTAGKLLPWLARAALVAVVLFALAGIAYPQFRPTEFAVGQDEVSHVLIAYAVTLLSALSLPRVSPLAIALLFGCAAIAIEAAQGVGLVRGAAELRDAVADAVGIAAALVPLAVVRARRAARLAGA